ncbi:MAG: 4'-phosphopantetheinyl transferase superfamily protein [Clostridia bacterium]|nr:4'-phosphopantetheinyl transferase superfamily protein [Clostridia bacterium]
MRLYYSDIRGLDESKAKYPPMSPNHGSAFGTSLLAVAYGEYNTAVMPKIKKLISGKPYFPGNEGFHFSISHSRTHVICAVSKRPVGVDTIDFRSVPESVVHQLTTAEEREHLSFYEIWALRESLYKLTGEGDLKTMRFYMKSREIIAPVPGVFCRLYDEIEDSAAAVCSFADNLPDKLIKIPSKMLLRDNNKLDRKLDEFFCR